MAEKITIVSTRQDAGFDTNGRPVETMRTEFRIGENGPFVVRLPKEGWSAAIVNEKIAEMARELEQLRNT